MADRADPRRLYEIAVQQPIAVIELIERQAALRGGASPRVLREDFCGSANLASLWVRSAPDRRAIAVDADAEAIADAEAASRAPLSRAADRLRLICADVRACDDAADVIVSLNFSHCVLHDRESLLGYLRHARRCLTPGGMLILDLYGGPGAERPGTDRRRFGDFTYLWQQASFDPDMRRAINHIHFEFPDGSRTERAFTYDWRLWTVAETLGLLEEAGMIEPRVLYETPAGLSDEIDPDADAWVAYVISAAPSGDPASGPPDV